MNNGFLNNHRSETGETDYQILYVKCGTDLNVTFVIKEQIKEHYLQTVDEVRL